MQLIKTTTATHKQAYGRVRMLTNAQVNSLRFVEIKCATSWMNSGFMLANTQYVGISKMHKAVDAILNTRDLVVTEYKTVGDVVPRTLRHTAGGMSSATIILRVSESECEIDFVLFGNATTLRGLDNVTNMLNHFSKVK